MPLRDRPWLPTAKGKAQTCTWNSRRSHLPARSCSPHSAPRAVRLTHAPGVACVRDSARFTSLPLSACPAPPHPNPGRPARSSSCPTLSTSLSTTMPALQGQAAQEALCPQRRRSIKMLIRGSKLLQKSHLSSPPYADPRPSPSLPITVLCTADSAFRLTWAVVPKSPTPCKAASHPGPAPLGLGAGLCATPLGLQDRAETGVKSVSDGGEDEDCSPIELPGTNSPKMLHSSSGAL